MSGCGRKHRAKHLVRQFLDDEAWDGPEKAGDILAVCISAPAAKHVHVVLVEDPTTKATTDEGPDALPPVEKKEGVDEASQAPVAEEVAPSSLPSRAVADLPGKFNKVLWLGCGDLIVLRLGSVHYKPSPQQLKYFYASPEGKLWEPKVQKAEAAARQYFKTVQSQSVTNVANQNLSGGGKFTARNQVEGGNSTNVLGVGATEQPTAAKHSKVAEVDPLAGMLDEDGSGEDVGDLNSFVNPNRQSIKHRRQAFFPDEDENEDEEEENDEEEDDA